jgi:hypothetical protein
LAVAAVVIVTPDSRFLSVKMGWKTKEGRTVRDDPLKRNIVKKLGRGDRPVARPFFKPNHCQKNMRPD